MDQLDFDANLNPRKETLEEDLESLATSIKQMGQIDPIKVINREKHWIVVDGQRRVLALRYLQEQGLGDFNTVKAVDISKSKRNLLLDNVIDVIFRANITYSDRARAIVKLLDQKKLTPLELANGLGKTLAWIQENQKVVQIAEITNKQQLNKIDRETVVKIHDLPIADDIKTELIDQLPSVPPSIRTKAISIIKKKTESEKRKLQKKDVSDIIAKARTIRGGGILRIKIPIRQTTYDKAVLCKPTKLSVEDYLGYMLDLGATSWQTAMILENAA